MKQTHREKRQAQLKQLADEDRVWAKQFGRPCRYDLGMAEGGDGGARGGYEMRDRARSQNNFVQIAGPGNVLSVIR